MLETNLWIVSFCNITFCIETKSKRPEIFKGNKFLALDDLPEIPRPHLTVRVYKQWVFSLKQKENYESALIEFPKSGDNYHSSEDDKEEPIIKMILFSI